MGHVFLWESLANERGGVWTSHFWLRKFDPFDPFLFEIWNSYHVQGCIASLQKENESLKEQIAALKQKVAPA